MESSRELLMRVQAGDRQALDDLCTRYLPRLRRWARGRLPSWARERFETDDLVQETVLQAVGRLDGFVMRFDGALGAYLRQAVLNQVRDEVRRARRRPPPPSDSQLPAAADLGPSPLEQTIGQEALERYEAALALLTPDEREAIVSRVEMDLPYAEIAEILGKPSPDAARMAVSRALVRLAREMAAAR